MAGLIYLTILLWTTMYNYPDRLSGVMIMIISFLTLTSLILIREAKFKWNRIEITDAELLVSSFFGLGLNRKTRLSEVTGYTRSLEMSKTSDGQAIYIYINNKRAVEVSDAYYKNFHQISAGLKGRIKKLGKENSSILKNVLNTFGKPIRIAEE